MFYIHIQHLYIVNHPLMRRTSLFISSIDPIISEAKQRERRQCVLSESFSTSFVVSESDRGCSSWYLQSVLLLLLCSGLIRLRCPPLTVTSSIHRSKASAEKTSHFAVTVAIVADVR